MKPIVLISGQSVCSGCGSDDICRLRVSLLTKSTRVPGETVSMAGLTPADVMVIVMFAFDGSGVTVGADGDPPQFTRSRTTIPDASGARLRVFLTPGNFKPSGPERWSVAPIVNPYVKSKDAVGISLQNACFSVVPALQ